MAKKTIEDRMNRGDDLTDRMALDARFNLAEKIGGAANNDPIVNQALSAIGMGRHTPVDGLCLAIRMLSENCDRLARFAQNYQAVNGTVKMVFEESYLHKKFIQESVAKDARIVQLEREVSILRNLSRVRLAPGEFGGE